MSLMLRLRCKEFISEVHLKSEEWSFTRMENPDHRKSDRGHFPWDLRPLLNDLLISHVYAKW